MSRFSIYVTRALPDDALRLLRSDPLVARVDVNPHDRPLGRQELEAAHADRDGAIVLLMDRIDDALFERANKLRAVACYSVGTDNVDLGAAARRGIAVMNTPDVLTEATADLAWALLL